MYKIIFSVSLNFVLFCFTFCYQFLRLHFLYHFCYNFVNDPFCSKLINFSSLPPSLFIFPVNVTQLMYLCGGWVLRILQFAITSTLKTKKIPPKRKYHQICNVVHNKHSNRIFSNALRPKFSFCTWLMNLNLKANLRSGLHWRVLTLHCDWQEQHCKVWQCIAGDNAVSLHCGWQCSLPLHCKWWRSPSLTVL